VLVISVPPGQPPISAEKTIAGSFGVIALAAFEPEESLFARQLLSIQSQTHSDFQCLISVDGNPSPVQGMVRRTCGDDNRFRVLGYQDRLGFHRNFERTLTKVPERAKWVALSDQDDYWYPEKLAALLPHLENAELVTGQARVVSAEVSAQGIDPSAGSITERRRVSATDFIANNQVTGSLCVFRRELLDVALPFPTMATPAQYHDHWIGLCALATGGVSITDDVVQDYIQHTGNVVGESRQSILKSVRNTRRIVHRYERDASPASMTRLIYKTGLGWRSLMATSLLERAGASIPPEVQDALRIYSLPQRTRLVLSLVGGLRRRTVSPVRFLEIGLGILLRRWAARA
jgi:glycosyltransferase involved in cell wall biosynthesis